MLSFRSTDSDLPRSAPAQRLIAQMMAMPRVIPPLLAIPPDRESRPSPPALSFVGAALFGRARQRSARNHQIHRPIDGYPHHPAGPISTHPYEFNISRCESRYSFSSIFGSTCNRGISG